MQDIIGWARIALGFAVMVVGVLVWVLITLVLLPSRIARIKACNYFGKIICGALVRLSGCPFTLRGGEHLDGGRPAIYVSNHTSVLDLFIASSRSPVGTVGIAKKEVIWYPFFGQLYLLSGHLRIDRGSTSKAVKSLKQLATFVREKDLSIFLWPEGTRSRDGRLLPFKKGLVHLAVQTGLPVVPFVVKGAHEAWRSRSFRVRRVPIEVEVLPAIDTSDWDLDHIEEHLLEVRQAFLKSLPEEQLPLAA